MFPARPLDYCISPGMDRCGQGFRGGGVIMVFGCKLVTCPSPSWAQTYSKTDRPSAAMNTEAHGDGSHLSMPLPLITSSCVCSLPHCTNTLGGYKSHHKMTLEHQSPYDPGIQPSLLPSLVHAPISFADLSAYSLDLTVIRSDAVKP